ncbi:hypothetical protein NQ318_001505 [Aromia moschata]|uniref:FAM86 N-terminal domain-containing protein n=1 Tax=Aromia moschata TaxID=1265417 RepID=A0AAV8Y8E2_9CUCU|nr:hypothetical protein NQ318_001505 [Aromia moschata]
MNVEKLSEKFSEVIKQFLCCVPVKNIRWNGIFEDLTYEEQDVLLSKTVNSELILKRPIQTSYQRAFLKHIIEKLELQGSEIHDNLYSSYGRLVSLPSSTEQYFKHYLVQSGFTVSLKENVNLISDGTTGLRTWQASLVLSEWALQNKNELKDNVVLELGSGIGLTGLIIGMQCSTRCVYLTDCHSSVLKTLCDNLDLNIHGPSGHQTPNVVPNTSDTLKKIQDRCLYGNSSSNIFVLDLPWEHINETECRKLGSIHKVVAADVVFDSDLFEPLINAIKSLAKFSNVEEFIFSCTERNRETLEAFVKQVEEALFDIEECDIPEQYNFIWPTDTPIRIFRFKLRLKKFLQ